MGNPNYTTLDVLLQAVRSEIITTQVFSESCCVMAINPDAALNLISTPGEPILIITPRKQLVHQRIRIGAGRPLMEILGNMETTIYSRLAQDRSPFDHDWFNDQSFGAISKMNDVINTIELYQPRDQLNNWLMPYGFELQEISIFTKEVNKEGWGSICLLWKMEYSLQLNPNAYVS